MVAATNTHNVKQISEYNWRKPSAKATAPPVKPVASGQAKLRFRLSAEVLRQASSGPTPVRNNSSKPMGTFTLLKNGAPTLIRELDSHSEKTGNNVPESTAMQDTSRIKLLKRKLDSRETMASS